MHLSVAVTIWGDTECVKLATSCQQPPSHPGLGKHTLTHTHAAALHVLSHARVLLAMRLSCVYIQNGGFFLHLHSSFLLLSGGNVGDTPQRISTTQQRCKGVCPQMWEF